MKYLYLFVLFFIGIVNTVQAQQPSQYSLYTLNPYAYNSAYNGLDGSLSATGVFRKQWVSFPGSPLTVNFNVHMPIEYLNSGVGIGIEYDEIGAEKNLLLKGSYSYIIPVGQTANLSIGGSLNYMQKTLDGSLLRAPEGIYEGATLNHSDVLLPIGRSTSSALSFDAGAYFKHEQFEVGIAAIQLSQPIIEVDINSTTVQQIQFVRNYYLMGMYHWNITDKLSLHPAFLLKTDFVKWQPEITATVKYNDQFFGGLGFRGYSANTQDAVVVLAGMQITKNLMLAYSYDISISALRTFNSGSHEVVLNYNLNKPIGKEVPAKIIYNPRFL